MNNEWDIVSGNQVSFNIDKNHIDTVESARIKAVEQVRQIKSKPYDQRSRTENGMLAYYRREYGDLDKLIAPEPAPPKSKNDIIQDLLNKPESELSKEEFYMVNSHKHNIKKQTDKIISNVTRDIKAEPDLVAATLLDADPLEGEQLDMFSRLSGVSVDQETRDVYASLFDKIESNKKAKATAEIYNKKEEELLKSISKSNKKYYDEALNSNISRDRLLDAIGNDPDGAKSVLKSIKRNKAKTGALSASEAAKFDKLFMPDDFGEHVARVSDKVSIMDKYKMWHLEKKGLVDSTTNRVAKARMAVGAEVPEKIAKKISKEVTSSNTLASAARGNKSAVFGGIMSGAMAISDFKENRKEGKTVIESAGSAAFEFAKGEVLGLWGMAGLSLVKGVPKAAVSVYNEVQSVNRSMNNLQRFTPFSDSEFADTQQLATMRQSGMEMAKMANYNLQQTLMGTEAKYLHR